MSAVAMLTALRLALGAVERGDRDGAIEALEGVLKMSVDVEPAPELRAVSKRTLARLLECTPRHVEHLERKGTIPPSAIIGAKSSKRYIVGAVFTALAKGAPAHAVVDAFAEEVRADVRARSKLKLVGGSR